MRDSKIRLISLALAVLIALSCFMTGAYAAGGESTVYFKNALNWSKVYIYAWDASDNPLMGDWPGTAMTNSAEAGVYTANIPANTDGVVFTDGSNMTTDIFLSSTSVRSWQPTGERDGGGHYIVESYAAQQTTTTVKATTAAATNAPVSVSGKIWFTNTLNWNKVYAFPMDDSFDALAGDWPGIEMTYDSASGRYFAEIPQNSSVLVFSNDGNAETVDIDLDLTSDIGWAPTGQRDSRGYYCVESYEVQQPATAAPTTAAPTTAIPTTAPISGSSEKIWFANTLGWSKVYVYIWDDDFNSVAGDWPGTEMIYDSSKGKYYAFLPANATELTFTDNNKAETVDVELDGNSYNGWMPTGQKDSKGYYTLHAYYESDTPVQPTTKVQPTTAQPTTKAQPTTAQPTTKAQPTTAQPTTKVQPTTVQPTTAQTTTKPQPTTVQSATEETVPDYNFPDTDNLFTVKAVSNYFPNYSMSFNKSANQVTVTYALVSSKDLVNIEWYLDYDNTVLKFDRAANMNDDSDWTMMPKVKGGLFNVNDDNSIKANNSSVGSLSKISSKDGKPVDLITVTFEVLRPVDTEINLRFRNLTLGSTDPATRMLDESTEEQAVNKYNEVESSNSVSARSTVLYEGGYQNSYSPLNNSGKMVYDSNFKFSSYSISLAENIAMSFNALSSAIPEGELGVLVEQDGIKSYINSWEVNSDKYVFTYDKIYPQAMGDEIKATLICVRDDGSVVYGPEYVRSVTGYASKQLSKADFPAEGKTLLVNLLNYGAAAQNYAGYKTDKLVNAGLTEEQENYAIKELGTLKNVKNYHAVVCPNAKATWKSASIALGSSIQVSVVFTADTVENRSVLVSDENGYSEEISAEDFEYVSDNRYRATYKSLYSFQTSDTLSFTVMENGAPVSDTMTYSVSSYADRYLKLPNGDPATAELITAMMLYGKAAEAFR